MKGFVQRRGVLLPGLALLALSIAIAVFAGVFNLLAADVAAATQIAAAGPDSWIGRPDARQWDDITALGLTGALAAASVVSASVRARRSLAFAAAAAWSLVETGLLLLVWHASENTAGDLLLWQLAGAALLVASLATLNTTR
jgi:hypothetical protein